MSQIRENSSMNQVAGTLKRVPAMIFMSGFLVGWE